MVFQHTTTNPTSLHPPTRANNRRKHPRHEGTTSQRVSPRTCRRLTREEAASQPFSRKVHIGGPSIDGIIDATGQRPIRTLSSIIRPQRNQNSNASSESGSATSSDEGESIDASIGEDGEVPRDSDYLGTVPRQGPRVESGGNEPIVAEVNANTSRRILRHGRR